MNESAACKVSCWKADLGGPAAKCAPGKCERANAASDLGWDEFIDPDNCEFCGKPNDGRPISHAIDGAWAHTECLDFERKDDDE